MKRFMSCCVYVSLCMWSSVTYAQDVTVRRITPHVIALSVSNMGTHTNVTVIESQKGLVVIETEITPFVMQQIKAKAEQTLNRNDWAYVINTHGHLHHAGGNNAFPNTPVIGPKGMSLDWMTRLLETNTGRKQYCKSVGVTDAIKRLQQLLTRPSLTLSQKANLRRKLNFCFEVQKEILSGFDVKNSTLRVEDQFNLDLGDIHLDLFYWGQAICHSSIFLHIKEEHMLVGMGMAGTWMPDLYGQPSLEGIRRGISMWNMLCDTDFQIDYMVGIHNPSIQASKLPFQRQSTLFPAFIK